MSKFYFNKNWILLQKKKAIVLYNFVSSKELFISDDLDKSRCLIEKLRSTTSTNTEKVFTYLKNKFPDTKKKWLADSIKQLRGYGIIKTLITIPKDITHKYALGLDRQIDYFEDLFPDKNKYLVQKKLKDAKICVLGLGSVGQSVIQCLVAFGIGSFVCADFDIVEERNIGLQPIFRRSDIGKTKVSVVKKYIEESRSGNKGKIYNRMIKSSNDVEKIISNSDLVLHCCDYPRFIIHQWINEACMVQKKPNLLIHAGRVGPFAIPGKSSCFGCLERFYEKHFSSYTGIRQYIINEGFGRYPTLAIIPFLTGVTAAKEVLAFILGMPYHSHNGFLDIKPYSLSIVNHELKQQKNCYVCGKRKQK